MILKAAENIVVFILWLEVLNVNLLTDEIE